MLGRRTFDISPSAMPVLPEVEAEAEPPACCTPPATTPSTSAGSGWAPSPVEAAGARASSGSRPGRSPRSSAKGRKKSLERESKATDVAPAARPASREHWRLALAESWALAKRYDASVCSAVGAQRSAPEHSTRRPSAPGGKAARFVAGLSGFNKWSSSRAEAEDERVGKPSETASSSSSRLPENFAEMVAFNCRMMGYDSSFIELMRSKLDDIVSVVSSGNEEYLELEANLLALRIHKDGLQPVDFDSFLSCVLAALRSLLGDAWTEECEAAWTQMWEAVTAKLKPTIPLVVLHERPVLGALSSFSLEEKKRLGAKAMQRLFVQFPKSEAHFKMNNSRLGFIVAQAMDMVADLYTDPVRVSEVATVLGLRHIMFQASAEYFEPWALSVAKEFRLLVADTAAADGFAWGLTQVAALVTRAFVQGSTPLLEAVFSNSPKKVRAALAGVPRQERAAAVL